MRSRLLTSLAGLALVLATVAVTPPAEAAAGQGQINVVMVDDRGEPAVGGISVVGDGALIGISAQKVSELVADLDPGAYVLMSITPWGGLICVGATTCGLGALGATPTPDGSLVITEGQVTNVRVEADVPATLHGSGQVGKVLELEYSEGIEALVEYAGGVAGLDFSPSVTWLRDGEPIDGADDDSYVPGPADAGHEISAVLEYTGVALTQFLYISGGPPAPITVGGVKVSKVKTQAFTSIFDPTIDADREAKLRVDVTAPNQIVPGKVRVAVGDWSQTRSLRNGSARFVLPQLAPGKHTVTATYLGTSSYAPSRAKPKTITVSR